MRDNIAVTPDAVDGDPDEKPKALDVASRQSLCQPGGTGRRGIGGDARPGRAAIWRFRAPSPGRVFPGESAPSAARYYGMRLCWPLVRNSAVRRTRALAQNQPFFFFGCSGAGAGCGAACGAAATGALFAAGAGSGALPFGAVAWVGEAAGPFPSLSTNHMRVSCFSRRPSGGALRPLTPLAMGYHAKPRPRIPRPATFLVTES